MTEQGYEDLVGSNGGRLYVVVLSLLAEAFALLTLGLVRPWGEVVPQWLPFVGGRRVRPTVAVVAASIGVVVLLAMWTPFLLWWALDHDDMTATGHTVVGFLYLPLVAWAPLLAAVTLDYRRRHRAPPSSPLIPADSVEARWQASSAPAG